MTEPGGIEVQVQRRRLMLMLGLNAVCLIIAGAALVGAFAFHLAWMGFVFVAALVVGFGAHVWLMLGVAHGGPRKGSV